MIKEKENKLIETLNIFENYNDKFNFLIEITNNKYDLENILRVEANKVKGCQSDLWLMGFKNEDKIYFNFYTESIFPKAILFNILELINFRTKKEILDFEITFLDKSEIINYITPVRKKGISSIIQKIYKITNEI